MTLFLLPRPYAIRFASAAQPAARILGIKVTDLAIELAAAGRDSS
jgi:hypothetical protein